MNVPLITMPTDVAQEAYDRYRTALETHEATDEDKQVLLGYKALAAGKQILDLHNVFRQCPANQQGLPCFAVGRANWKWCHLGWIAWRQQGNGMVFGPSRSTIGQRNRNVLIPTSVLPENLRAEPKGYRWNRALVPTIPPSVRPKSNLHRYRILWEAEWQAVPPIDPILLHKLSGSLYVVLAMWDLSELERAVLAGRFLEG